LEYEGARIQLLDLPGIVQDAAKGAYITRSNQADASCSTSAQAGYAMKGELMTGRGRGRQVVSVAKTADLIILMSMFTAPPSSPFSYHRLSPGTPLTCAKSAQELTHSRRDETARTEKAARDRIGSGGHQIEYQSARCGV
jgi:hypothetical protein